MCTEVNENSVIFLSFMFFFLFFDFSILILIIIPPFLVCFFFFFLNILLSFDFSCSLLIINKHIGILFEQLNACFEQPFASLFLLELFPLIFPVLLFPGLPLSFPFGEQLEGNQWTYR